MIKIAGSIAVLLLLALLLPIAPSFPVYAGDGGTFADVYVNGTTGNAGYDGSSPVHSSGNIGPKKTVVQGISTVADNGTVHVAAGTYHEHGIDLNNAMNLIGDGALTTIIDGDSSGFVLEVSSLPFQYNTISGFTIQNGAPSGSDSGGGIFISPAHITTINDCAIINNVKGAGSGPVPNTGGGVCNAGVLYMNRCTVSGNTAGILGGGIANINESFPSEGVYGVMVLTNCTISGNSVTASAGEGGGIFNSENALAHLLNVTIANNHATDANSFGGGFGNNSVSSMYFKNCIVANNTAGHSQYNNGYDGLGTGTHSQGFNLDSQNSCFFNQPTDQINTDPQLGPLQNNGGPTSTMAITSASPAFHRGTNDGAPSTDQRGVSRPQAGICDIGAYELISGATTGSVNTSLGTVNFTTSAGSISGLTNIPSDRMPCSAGGFIFPYGMFSYSITNLAPGATVIVTITTPIAVPMGSKIFKCQNGNLTDFSANSIQIDSNTFRLTITDGGPGDADGVANGTIVDPCGPAFSDTGNHHRGSTPQAMAPQGPAPIANIAVQSASLSTAKVAPGAPITITADVANKGTANGSTQVKLYVNGQEEAYQGVTLSSGGNTPVKFTVSRNEPGSYSVYVGSMPAGTFEVDRFADLNLILYISGVLLLFALAGGIIFMAMRRPR
ncbi:MAG: choice-of-anchor U domain-containing protein [Dehalococcoidia bacterium]|jgi:hypothetical protein